MNAATPAAFASFDAMGIYTDGSNPYVSFGSNPITGRDPSGLFSLLDVSAAQGIYGDANSFYLDASASLVDATKGLALLAYERNAALDDLLSTESTPFDFTGIDQGLKVYAGFRTAQAAVFGAILGGKLFKAGANLWRRFAARAGSRQALIRTLRGGTNRLRRLFRFGRRSSARWVAANPRVGWKVGDPINNLTHAGNRPSWTTIRERYWKNAAHYVGADTAENLARMRNGRAPQRETITGAMESMELHHPLGRQGDNIYIFDELWPDEHAGIDPRRHLGG